MAVAGSAVHDHIACLHELLPYAVSSLRQAPATEQQLGNASIDACRWPSAWAPDDS